MITEEIISWHVEEPTFLLLFRSNAVSQVFCTERPCEAGDRVEVHLDKEEIKVTHANGCQGPARQIGTPLNTGLPPRGHLGPRRQRCYAAPGDAALVGRTGLFFWASTDVIVASARHCWFRYGGVGIGHGWLRCGLQICSTQVGSLSQ